LLFLQIEEFGRLVPVAHICNPSYSEAEIRRIKVQGQPRQKKKKKKSETLSQKCPTQKKKRLAMGFP
jgi:hypothetical protein